MSAIDVRRAAGAREHGRRVVRGPSCRVAGRALRAIGRSADLAVCAGLDDLEVVPVWRDGALVGSWGGEDA